MSKPTKRQAQVLATIEGLRIITGSNPTLRQLGEKLGIHSTNGVASHVYALKRLGLVVWDPRKARTLRATASGLRLLGIKREAA